LRCLLLVHLYMESAQFELEVLVGMRYSIVREILFRE
jgi:hypothetical protein